MPVQQGMVLVYYMGGQIDIQIHTMLLVHTGVVDMTETTGNAQNWRLIDDVELIHHNRDDVFLSD